MVGFSHTRDREWLDVLIVLLYNFFSKYNGFKFEVSSLHTLLL